MTDLKPVLFIPKLSWNWLWQPSLINHKVAEFIYCPYFAFVESYNGRKYRVGEKITIPKTPTEASIVFFQNQYVAIVRTTENAVLGVSKNGDEWQ